MNLPAYWISNYIFDILKAEITMVIAIGLFYAFEVGVTFSLFNHIFSTTISGLCSFFTQSVRFLLPMQHHLFFQAKEQAKQPQYLCTSWFLALDQWWSIFLELLNLPLLLEMPCNLHLKSYLPTALTTHLCLELARARLLLLEKI